MNKLTNQQAKDVFQAIQTLGAATRYVANNVEVITVQCQNPTMIQSNRTGIIGIHLNQRFVGGISYDTTDKEVIVNTVALQNAKPTDVAILARLHVALASAALAIQEAL